MFQKDDGMYFCVSALLHLNDLMSYEITINVIMTHSIHVTTFHISEHIDFSQRQLENSFNMLYVVKVEGQQKQTKWG